MAGERTRDGVRLAPRPAADLLDCRGVIIDTGGKLVVIGLWGSLVACTQTTAESDGASDETAGASTGQSLSDSSSSGEPMVSLPVSLVRAEAWELAPADEDPLPDERPDFVQCEIGWDVEVGTFEVNTELCTYGTFVQTTLAQIREGDTLEFILIHDALYADEPATAHIAIAFGTEIAWETEVPIPSEPDQIRTSWTAPADVTINSPVYLHLHNHGTNNYRIIDLTVQAAGG